MAHGKITSNFEHDNITQLLDNFCGPFLKLLFLGSYIFSLLWPGR